jgi:hypothetical protein
MVFPVVQSTVFLSRIEAKNYAAGIAWNRRYAESIYVKQQLL